MEQGRRQNDGRHTAPVIRLAVGSSPQLKVFQGYGQMRCRCVLADAWSTRWVGTGGRLAVPTSVDGHHRGAAPYNQSVLGQVS
jgi:hypothetical protein